MAAYQGLTQKQEEFCLAYIETSNASEAYRRAYSAANMKPETIHVKATELLKNGKVSVRIAEIRKPAVESAQMTLEGHLTDLKELRDAAKGEGQYAAAISAEVSRGKASGFYVNKTEITGKDGETLNIGVTFVKPDCG